jgi:hypothetical protein
MGYKSSKRDDRTDEIIKEMKKEYEKSGVKKSEIDIVREHIERGAERMGIEIEDEKEDDFMDVFK